MQLTPLFDGSLAINGWSLLTVSYHRNFGLPLGRFPSILIPATAQMFSVSSLLLTCPNHSSLLSLITVAIGSTFASSKISFLLCSNVQAHAHRTILISVVAIRFSSLNDIGHVSHPYLKQSRSNHCLIYQELQFCWNFLVAYHSTQFSPFRPCLCYSVLHFFAGSSSSVYS